MSLVGSRSRLAAISKELLLDWQQTKEHWRDAKSAEFEHRFIEELFARVDKSVVVLEQLDEILGRIRKDCD